MQPPAVAIARNWVPFDARSRPAVHLPSASYSSMPPKKSSGSCSAWAANSSRIGSASAAASGVAGGTYPPVQAPVFASRRTIHSVLAGHQQSRRPSDQHKPQQQKQIADSSAYVHDCWNASTGHFQGGPYYSE